MSDSLLATALQTYRYCLDKQNRKVSLTADEKVYMTSGTLLEGIWDAHFETAKAAFLSPSGDGKQIEFEDFRKEHGCICLEVENTKFWYPVAISALCPTGNILDSLAKAAEKSRLFCDSRICLSGSSVLMGATPHVGDLDLFEYVFSKNVAEALTEAKPKYRTDEVMCTKLKVSNSREGEWPEFDEDLKKRITCLRPEKMRRFAAKYLLEYNFCKLDMIGKFGDQIGEITNIIYLMPDGEDSHSEFPSFSFQEVVLGDNPPLNGAYSLKNFGDYVFFLRDEIEKGLIEVSSGSTRRIGPNGDEIKAAIKVSKRALVLSTLICQSNELIEAFTKVLTAHESQKYALTSAQDCLKLLIQNENEMAIESMTWLTESLQKLLENPAKEKIELTELVAALEELGMAFDALCYPEYINLKENQIA